MINPRKLRKARIDAKFSQVQLSRASGVAQPMISRMENPKFIVDPQLSTVERICDVLGCSIHDITSPGSPAERSKVVIPKDEEVEKRRRRPRLKEPVAAVAQEAEVMGGAQDQT